MAGEQMARNLASIEFIEVAKETTVVSRVRRTENQIDGAKQWSWRRWHKCWLAFPSCASTFGGTVVWELTEVSTGKPRGVCPILGTGQSWIWVLKVCGTGLLMAIPNLELAELVAIGKPRSVDVFMWHKLTLNLISCAARARQWKLHETLILMSKLIINFYSTY